LGDDSLSGLLIVIALIGIYALLTMIYAALVNTRLAQMREMADDGNRRAAQVVRLVTSTSLTVTFKMLTTLLLLAIAGVAMLNIAAPLAAELAPDIPALLVHVLVLFLTGCVTVVVGDIVPESVGSSYPNSLALWFVGLMRALVLLLSPIVLLLLAISRAISSLFRSGNLVNTITEQEIMTLVDAGHSGGTIEEEEKEMIYSVLQLDQTRVSEVMVPRIDVVAVDINQSLEEVRMMFINSGYSRIPVYEDNIDHIRGLIYAKDLLAYWSNGDEPVKTIQDFMRPAYFVPETKRADELLKELQSQKIHLAIVVDEYGGTAGLVTIENIIEEIIGDIQDEYDLNEEAEYEQVTPDEYQVDASIDLDDFNDLLEVDLPTEDSDTLGGFIYTYFGRVPVVDEIIETDDLTMQVLSVDGRRIRKIHVIRKRAGDEDGDDHSGNGDSTDEAEHITRIS
jgi:putative hemolysin